MLFRDRTDGGQCRDVSKKSRLRGATSRKSEHWGGGQKSKIIGGAPQGRTVRGAKGAMPPINGLTLVNLPPSNRGLGGKILGPNYPKLGTEGAFSGKFSKFFKKLQHRNAIKSEVYRFLRN